MKASKKDRSQEFSAAAALKQTLQPASASYSPHSNSPSCWEESLKSGLSPPVTEMESGTGSHVPHNRDMEQESSLHVKKLFTDLQIMV